MSADAHEGPRSRSTGRWRRLGVPVLGSAALLTGFGYLLYGGIGENIVYYLTPTEFEARDESVQDRSVRLGGVVIPGSVQWDAEELDLRFLIGDGSTEMEVHSTGAPPQMFRDGIEVIVEGRMASTGVFESHNLMVKHSNEYRAPEEGQRPQDLYRDLLPEDERPEVPAGAGADAGEGGAEAGSAAGDGYGPPSRDGYRQPSGDGYGQPPSDGYREPPADGDQPDPARDGESEAP